MWFRVKVLRLRVWGFRVEGLRLWVVGLRTEALGFRAGLGFGVGLRGLELSIASISDCVV